MVNRKLISIRHNTDHLLEECKREFLTHHPEFENIEISYDKIVYETAKFYLKGV